VLNKKDKTFNIGELCVVPFHNQNEFNHAYGIIVRRNPLKLRRNFYSVFYNGKIKEHENLYIAKIEEIEDELCNAN
tara:strand:+ start:285 stop:512 length:228 start_codon:yes stop_codon:yes gene_type:complete